jgi:hypothetical protein
VSPIGSDLRGVLSAARRALRRDTAVATAAFTLLAIPLVLLVGWLLAGFARWSQPGFGPLLLELAALAAAVIAMAWLGRRWLHAVSETAVASDAEDRLGLPAGAVRGILELGRAVPDGTSAALYRRAERELDARFRGMGPVDVGGELRLRVRRRRFYATASFAALALLVVGLGLATPERSRAAWAPLLSPIDHLVGPPLPALALEPGDAQVLRGQDVRVHARAPLRSVATLHWRQDGDVLRRETLAIVDDTASAVIPRIDAPTSVWLQTPDGARTPVFRLIPVDALLVAEITFDVVYPGYLNRGQERFTGELPPLEVPAGTDIVIRGRATRSLATLGLQSTDGERRVDLAAQDERFGARWRPTASGTYTWHGRGSDGTPLAASPAPIDLVVVPDRAPTVVLTFPGVDTLIAGDLQQPIIADARDDYAVTAATLVSWRVSARGESEAPREQPMPIDAVGERVILRGVLDARERRLIPGDTLKYFVRVVDNSPTRQSGVSRTYALRLPSMAELRRHAEAEMADALERARGVAGGAGDLERQLRDANRRAAAAAARRGAGGSPQSPSTSGDLAFQDAERARQLLERQQSMLDQIDALREQLRAVERASGEAALRDHQTQQRLEELRSLYERVLTPEMRERLAEAQRRLGEMTPEELRRTLEALEGDQEELSNKLERNVELLERAAIEQEMAALAQEARELATQQHAVTEATKEGDTRSRAEQQARLAERAEDLAEAVARLEERLAEQGETRTAEQAGQAKQDARAAEREMERAAEQAAAGRRDEATKSGEEAADRLEKTAEKLDGARAAMVDEWQREVQDAMQQATMDALSLAERQDAVREEMEVLEQPQLPQQPGAPQLEKQVGGGEQQQERSGQSGQDSPQQGRQDQQLGEQGQRQSGQQPNQQQQGGQQQRGGQQQGGGQQQQGGREQGGQQGQQQDGGEQQGGQQGRQGAGNETGGSGERQRLAEEQAALQQGLEQLGRNIADASERSAMVNREVGSALGRANLSMQQTLEALREAERWQRMPTEEAAQSVDALNRLALALLNNAEQVGRPEGSGWQQAMEQLADLAKEQGGLTGQSSALLPVDADERAKLEQLNRMGREQREIAQKIAGLSDLMGGREDATGRLSELAREAEQIARDLGGGRLGADVISRQERLFHRLLDAGRTLEKEETSEERRGEAARQRTAPAVAPLDAALLEALQRYRVPTPDELQALPPSYRRLILEYFERLNRAAPAPNGTAREERR